MIRKQTWIVLGVFIVLLGFAFYLQKNPQVGAANATPSATVQPQLLPGLTDTDVVSIERKDQQGGTLQVSQDAQGDWLLGPENTQKVTPGPIEEARSQITSTLVLASVPENIDRTVTGLAQPATILTLKDKTGKQTELRIGNATPTGSGYYLQVNNQAPVIVDKGSVDGFLGSLTKDSLLLTTPTPGGAPSNTGEATPTPTP